MHTFRLLYMALDIARTDQVNIRQDNRRNQLLAIKQGQFSYEELLKQSQQVINDIEEAFKATTLPDKINEQAALDALIQIRRTLYQ